MNKITIFWKIYVPFQYGQLLQALKFGIQALFWRRNPNSPNPKLVFDHGVFWKLLRDGVVIIATVIRFAFGLLVFASLLVLLPTATILRALFIPFVGLWKGWRVSRLKEK